MGCLEYKDVYGTVTKDTPAWNGSARSNLEFTGDAFFGCEVPLSSIGVIVGFNQNDVTPSYTDIDHGMYFHRGRFDVVERGTVIPLGLTYTAGMRYYIVRFGTQVIYCQRAAGLDNDAYYGDPRYPGVFLPGAIVYISTLESFGTIFIDTSFYATDDRLFCEWMAESWYPGIEDGTPPAQINVSLPFVGKLADVENFAFGELPFDVDATGVTVEGITGELPFTALLADQPINTLIIGELPFTAYADTNGIYEVIQGISGALLFSASGGMSIHEADITVELPFIAFATCSESESIIDAGIYGELSFEALAISDRKDVEIASGAHVELPLSVFGITARWDEHYTSGIDAQLPFTAFATTTDATDTPATAGAFVELPFVGFATTTNPTDTPATAGVYAQLQFEAYATSDYVYYPVTAGAYAELPFVAFATGTDGVETPATAGMFVDLPFTIFATSDNVDWTVPTAGAYVPLPFVGLATSSAAGETPVTAGVYGEFSFDAFATGGDLETGAIDGGIYGEFRFTVGALMEAHTENAFNIYLTFNTYGDDPGPDPGLSVEVTEDIIALTVPLQVAYVNKIIESVQVSSETQTFYTIALELLDELTVLAEAKPAFVLQLAESLAAGDSFTAIQALQIAEVLRTEDSLQTVYSGLIELLSAIAVASEVRDAYSTTIQSSVNVGDTLDALLKYVAALLDTVSVAATLQNVLTITVLETAEVEADDTIELDAQYFASMLDRVEVLAFIKTPAELAQGWVVNTEGAMPVSEYDNYAFNSLAYSQDQMLGCTDQGLYTLDGDNDDGTAIDAEITSLMLDFDTSKLKRMSTAYMGYTSTGQLLLRVRSVDQGEFVEYWYEGRNVDSQTPPGQNRMKIGKGLRSRYWTFELVNIDGSDFELDKVELYPIVLQRRI